jgi:hypothetical protein
MRWLLPRPEEEKLFGSTLFYLKRSILEIPSDKKRA